ncbi:MAG: VanZ family protein [Lachnospiraceae bacterium]|nr:VanZ family protein [Lachnospiraceae bacterium]
MNTVTFTGIATGLSLAVFLLEWTYNRIVEKRSTKWQMFKWPLLVFYLVMVLQIAFFSREPGSRDSIDLQLLGTWGTTAQAHAWVIENVLMFVPFGVLVPVCVKYARKLPMTVLLALVCSAGLEYAQFLTQRGHCQLDDVVMNVVGGIIGWILWRGGRIWVGTGDAGSKWRSNI